MARKKRVLVIGLGRFGKALAKELWNNGIELVLVDRDDHAVDNLKEYAHGAFVADSTDVRALEGAGLGEIDTAVVGIGESFEAAVLTVAALSKEGVGEIVARATSRERAEVLKAVGATRVHEVETEMGQRAALAITTPIAPDLLDFANQFRVIPWTADGPLVGKKLSECGIRQRYEINVLGIRRSGEAQQSATLQQPRADDVIAKGDTLLLVGEEHNVNRFVEEVGG